MIDRMKNIERLDVNSDHLRTFAVVAESGNVTHASLLLGRTQSAISVQIRKLEESLSVRLFDRQARGMKLTDDGRTLLPVARRALSEMQRINSLFSEPLRGRIRVGIPDDYDEMILERMLVDFGRRHSGVEILTQSGCTAEFPKAIAADELDLAVVSGANVGPEDAFYSEPTVWAASEDFYLPSDAPVPLAYLDRGCWWRDLPTSALDEHKRSWRRAYVTTNFASAKAAIRAGLAVGILPFGALDESMRMLTEADGFPSLPPTQRALMKNKKAPRELTTAMSEAILHAQLK